VKSSAGEESCIPFRALGRRPRRHDSSLPLQPRSDHSRVSQCLLSSCGPSEYSEDIPFLSNSIEREIIYRIFHGPEGARLRAIATVGDQSQRTAKAIAWIKANCSRPLRIEELAEVAGMAVSTLHHHFRAMTTMSPLQYQKQLRLQAARARMLTDDMDAATVAFEVGYESASQFNREYCRSFGQPPLRDIKALLSQTLRKSSWSARTEKRRVCARPPTEPVALGRSAVVGKGHVTSLRLELLLRSSLGPDRDLPVWTHLDGSMC
jgi:AraC-like DNA-binding protein